MKAVLRCCTLISSIIFAGQTFAAAELLSVNSGVGSADGTAVVFHFSAVPKDLPKPITKAANVLQLNFPNTLMQSTVSSTVDVNTKEISQVTLVTAGADLSADVQLTANEPYELEERGNDLILSVHAGGNTVENTALSIDNIQFQTDKDGAGVLRMHVIGDSKPKIDLDEQERNLLVSIENTEVAPQWVSTMNVSEFKTVVKTIKAANTEHSANLSLAMTEPYIVTQDFANHWLAITLQSKQKAEMDQQDSDYTGKKLSLNFQNIPVRSVIQIIADFTGINMVTSDSVQGNITLRLKNVPWDQALDLVLRTRGLSQRRIGNVIYIGPAAEVSAEEKAALDEQQQSDALAPLHEEYFRLSYAQASQMASILQSKDGGFLGPRGSVTVDTRTNTVLVRDTANQLDKIRKLIAHLDVPVPQILIEARIVQVTEEGVLELGVSTLPPVVPGTDPAAPPVLPPVIGPSGTTGGGAQGFINNGLADISGALGLNITGLPGGMNLNLELQALETEGNGKVISSPQLTVSDKQEAYIQQGTEIPYNESTSSGAAAIAFEKAVLSLRVTPQITPDNNVAMTLDVTNDSPSTTQVGAQSIPVINTSEITTQVLVKNGQTIVLGGIQIETKDHQVRRIPFLGNLPGIGWLFKSTSDTSKNNQLLIFLTPKIINGSDTN